jgi:hypothetical protein
MRLALEPFKAHFVPDSRNAVDVPPDVQLIVLDEVSPTNRPNIATLKALTSGSANIGSLNRKSYGHSYVPREDAQIVIISNHSPWEVYATWDANKKVKRAKSDTVGPFELWFTIYRLDGENLDEKVQWFDPEHLTPDEYRQHLRDSFYNHVRAANSTGNCSTALVKKVLVILFQIHSARTQWSSTYVNLANDLQDAIHVDDYLILLDIFDRFGTPMGFPYCAAHLEYNVHFRHDPRPDLYAELLANMRHHPALTPRWNRGDELSPAGPVVLHPGRERATRAAATAMRNRGRPQEAAAPVPVFIEQPQEDEPDPAAANPEGEQQQQQQQRLRPAKPPQRTDPSNDHHRALPHGTNASYVAPPTPPQPMVDADFSSYHDSERQFAWGPEPDEDELAEAAWHDSIDDSQ